MRRPGTKIIGNVRRGNCYVACEVLYHVMGGKAAGLTPCWLVCPWDPEERHWFLRQEVDPGRVRVIDPSAGQFTKEQRQLLNFHYAEGRGSGFLTKYPSKRARKLIEAMTWQEVPIARNETIGVRVAESGTPQRDRLSRRQGRSRVRPGASVHARGGADRWPQGRPDLSGRPRAAADGDARAGNGLE